jgi:hypothetical protein
VAANRRDICVERAVIERQAHFIRCSTLKGHGDMRTSGSGGPIVPVVQTAKS